MMDTSAMGSPSAPWASQSQWRDSYPCCCLQEELLKEWDEVPAVFTTSSREGEGRQQLMHYIAQLRMLFTGEAMPNMKMLTVAPVEEEADVPDVETVEHIPYPSQRSDQAVPN